MVRKRYLIVLSQKQRAKMENQLNALIKWEHCVNLIMDLSRRFPKALRPTLGRKLDEQCIDTLVSLSESRYLPQGDRGETLKAVDKGLATTRVLLRLARSRDAVSVGQYRHLSELVDECGRMIGGLRRANACSELDPEPSRYSSAIDK